MEDMVLSLKLVRLQHTFSSRGEAAVVLQEVADACRSGNFPSDVTLFDLGKAVSIAMVNCPTPEGNLWTKFEEFTRGFRDGRNEEGLLKF